MATIRRRVVISGRVQGVNFRYYTRSMARQVGAGGWVRNLSDGSVEAVIEGGPDVVEAVISWCRTGPPAGRVDDLKVYEEPPTGEFADFDIKYTGGYY
ncbi:MAG: acylphosphatase [Desulfomonile tiedjei]|nr:acylphosphatase [Desulfomonile tiedjei]